MPNSPFPRPPLSIPFFKGSKVFKPRLPITGRRRRKRRR